jgi:hypothetical protein
MDRYEEFSGDGRTINSHLHLISKGLTRSVWCSLDQDFSIVVLYILKNVEEILRQHGIFDLTNGCVFIGKSDFVNVRSINRAELKRNCTLNKCFGPLATIGRQ